MRARMAGNVTICFRVNIKLRQGCVIFPRVFNNYVEKMVRKVHSRTYEKRIKMIGRKQRDKFRDQLLFAEDTELHVLELTEQLQR